MRAAACLILTSCLSPLALAQTEQIPPAMEESFTHYIRFATELSPILRQVTDKDSADKAVPQLKKRLEEIYLLSKEIAKYDKLPAQLTEALSAKFGKSMRTEWGKVFEEIFRLQKSQCFSSLSFSQQLQALCTILTQ